MLPQLGFARSLLGEPTRSLDDARARIWMALDHRPRTAVVLATHAADDPDRCETPLELPC
jgi:hypothetical protein